MSLAQFMALVVTPFFFFGWGVVLAIPKAERPRSSGDSWWQSPPVFAGIAAVAMGLFTVSAMTDGGDIAKFVVLLAVVMALGVAFALWWRRKPIRSADTSMPPHPSEGR